MWTPENNLPINEKKEIYNYMQSLKGKKFYVNDISTKRILDYIILHFIGIVIKPCWKYDFSFFNAYLDENLTEEECDYRFYLRTDRKQYLETGQHNPHFMEKYWKVI